MELIVSFLSTRSHLIYIRSTDQLWDGENGFLVWALVDFFVQIPKPTEVLWNVDSAATLSFQDITLV